jgi:hypothetical protein
MRLDEQLDDALRRMPAWEPPAHFARRVARAAQSERRPVARQRQGLFWAGAAVQAAGVALVAYVGSSIMASAATSFVLALGMAFETYARSLSTFTL